MPTGYTAPIHDGEDISFEDFTLLCSRAMGARIMERDDPLKPTVPSPNVPSSYYRESLQDEKARLADLQTMTVAIAQERANEKFEKDLAYYQEYTAKREHMRRRYQSMIAKVNHWNPPTPDHRGLKDFMIEQLEDSIKFDCSPGYPASPIRVNGAEWLANELERAERNVVRYQEEWDKEVERTNSRNQWMVDLLESLHLDVPEGFGV